MRNSMADDRSQSRSTEAQIMLGYGDEQLPFSYHPDQFELLLPADFINAQAGSINLAAVLTNPIGSSPLTELVKSSDQVLIVVPDATRAAGVAELAPVLLAQLHEIGLSNNQISILIGGGIHRLPTPD